MNTENDASYEADDQALNRLILEAASAGSKEFVRPDETAIEAFLLGRASSAEREQLGRALDASKDFRRELLQMMRDVARLGEASASGGAGNAEQTVISLGEFRRAMQANSLRRRRAMGYALALAAALLLTVGVRLVWQASSRNSPMPSRDLSAWKLEQVDVDPGLLIANLTRHPGTSDTVSSYLSPLDAALAAFRNVLTLGDAGIELAEDVSFGLKPGAGRGVVVRYYDKNDLLLGESLLPSTVPDTGRAGHAWLLTLPSRNLYSLSVDRDTVETRADFDMDTLGCLVTVRAAPSGFLSGKAHPVLLRRPPR